MVSFITVFNFCVCFDFIQECLFEDSVISTFFPQIKLRSTGHLERNFIVMISRAELQKCLDNLQRNNVSPAYWCEAHFCTLRFVIRIWQAGIFVDWLLHCSPLCTTAASIPLQWCKVKMCCHVCHNVKRFIKKKMPAVGNNLNICAHHSLWVITFGFLSILFMHNSEPDLANNMKYLPPLMPNLKIWDTQTCFLCSITQTAFY